jgi:hypothetical protein
VKRQSARRNALYDKYCWPPAALQQRAALSKEIEFNSLLGAQTFARDKVESAFELKCGWLVLKQWREVTIACVEPRCRLLGLRFVVVLCGREKVDAGRVTSELKLMN